jgi:ribosomal protein S18 acetylase RimI-like enzyme
MIEIRNSFTAEELPDFYEIECVCFPELIRWDREEFDTTLAKSDVWVAEFVEDSCECGQIWNCTCNDTPKETRELAGFLVSKIKLGMGYIMSVDITPSHRRKGIGAKLMYAAEEHYQKLGLLKVFLEVARDNPAQTLYFKLGYRVTGFRQKYYDDGSACLVMTKTLDLLDRMNTSANRSAMRSAFNATPSELGRAAVAQAQDTKLLLP